MAFILVASVFMYKEGIHVDTKESNQIEIMSKFQSSCRVRNEDPDLPTKSRMNEDSSSALLLLNNAVSSGNLKLDKRTFL